MSQTPDAPDLSTDPEILNQRYVLVDAEHPRGWAERITARLRYLTPTAALVAEAIALDKWSSNPSDRADYTAPGAEKLARFTALSEDAVGDALALLTMPLSERGAPFTEPLLFRYQSARQASESRPGTFSRFQLRAPELLPGERGDVLTGARPAVLPLNFIPRADLRNGDRRVLTRIAARSRDGLTYAGTVSALARTIGVNWKTVHGALARLTAPGTYDDGWATYQRPPLLEQVTAPEANREGRWSLAPLYEYLPPYLREAYTPVPTSPVPIHSSVHNPQGEASGALQSLSSAYPIASPVPIHSPLQCLQQNSPPTQSQSQSQSRSQSLSASATPESDSRAVDNSESEDR